MSADVSADSVLLRARDVVKHFPVRKAGAKGSPTAGTATGRGKAVVHAVDGVDLELYAGETLGLVGESGCGKSTLGRCLVGLAEVTSGSIEVAGHEITGRSRRELRPMRRTMQMVFQDPYASLNPRKRVGSIIGLSLRVNSTMSRRQVDDRVRELLAMVGLAPQHAQRFPHEFSGGQRQRIGIARALALSPSLIVADEPVSALDVSIQAQVVNLLADLQDELGLSYIFIAHDLSVVRQVSDRIAVMYLGKIVEVGAAEDVVRRPAHPYTEALLSAVPSPVVTQPRRRQQIVLAGDVPSPLAPPPGCRFHPRCPYATDLCRTQEPALVVRDEPGRLVACHYPRTAAASPAGAASFLQTLPPTSEADNVPDHRAG